MNESKQVLRAVRKLIWFAAAPVPLLVCFAPSFASDNAQPQPHFDLSQPTVRAVLLRFAQNENTTFSEVEALLHYDVNAGIWVISNREFSGKHLRRCSDVVIRLPRLDESQVLTVAKVYYQWADLQPKTFNLESDDIIRRSVLADMLKKAKTPKARDTIRGYIHSLKGDGTNIGGAIPNELKGDPSLEHGSTEKAPKE